MSFRYAHLLCDRLHEVSKQRQKTEEDKRPECFLLERLISRTSAQLNAKNQTTNDTWSHTELGYGSNDSLMAQHSPRSMPSFLPQIFGSKHSISASQQQLSGNQSISTMTCAPPVALDANLHDKIRDSRAVQPYTNPMTGWDWELVDLALCQLWDCLNKQEEDRNFGKHLDDSICGKFLNNLMQFYWPQSGQFGKLTEDWKALARSGCTMMRLAVLFPKDSVVWTSLRNFLTDLNQNLVQVCMYSDLLWL